MKLLTKAIIKKAPALYSQDGKDPKDVNIVAKFFTPWGKWSWFMTELDPETGDAFGFVDGQFPEIELGYFNINELAKIRGQFGLGVERDISFTGTLAEVMA